MMLSILPCGRRLYRILPGKWKKNPQVCGNFLSGCTAPGLGTYFGVWVTDKRLMSWGESEAVIGEVHPLQFHPNRHNRFSLHGYYRFIFHRYRNSIYDLKIPPLPMLRRSMRLNRLRRLKACPELSQTGQSLLPGLRRMPLNLQSRAPGYLNASGVETDALFLTIAGLEDASFS